MVPSTCGMRPVASSCGRCRARRWRTKTNRGWATESFFSIKKELLQNPILAISISRLASASLHVSLPFVLLAGECFPMRGATLPQEHRPYFIWRHLAPAKTGCLFCSKSPEMRCAFSNKFLGHQERSASLIPLPSSQPQPSVHPDRANPTPSFLPGSQKITGDFVHVWSGESIPRTKSYMLPKPCTH